MPDGNEEQGQDPRPEGPQPPPSGPPPGWNPPPPGGPPAPPRWDPPTGPANVGPPTQPQQPQPPPGYQPPQPPPGQGGYPPPQPGGYGQPPGYGPPGAYPQGGGPPKGPKGKKGLIAVAIGVVVLLVGAGLIIALTGGDDDESDVATEDTEGGGGGQLITDVQDIERATVQIVSQGSFVDPVEGALEGAGAGTGFIIDPSGLVVTNNHVVTGAATLEVFVGGMRESLNAQILGTSECSDLAVIDLEGDGFPYVEFYEGEITTGLEVFAAGFPLGDPEFTLTRGIVSKANASGETNWASVDDVIEHDANINPGNSGGPLVTESAEVVAINYAGDNETNRYFAIAPPTATQVVDQLRDEQFVDYLGINGQAVVSEDGSYSGVWVAAVESGSPAADLGLQGGDIIERLEGLTLGTDGSLADYCDILRTQGTDAELAAQVYRVDTEEVFQGAFNSGEEMELAEFLGDDIEDSVNAGTGSEYTSYETVSDDSGAISVEVPSDWADINGAPLDDGSPSLVATTSLENFNTGFTEPGVLIASLTGYDAADPDGNLDLIIGPDGIDASTACPQSEGRQDYDDGLYTGRYEVLSGCDGTDAAFAAVVASPEGGEFIIFVGVQIASDSDLEALDRVLASFVVTQ